MGLVRDAVISFFIFNLNGVYILHELGGVFKPPILFLQPITQLLDSLTVCDHGARPAVSH